MDWFIGELAGSEYRERQIRFATRRHSNRVTVTKARVVVRTGTNR